METKSSTKQKVGNGIKCNVSGMCFLPEKKLIKSILKWWKEQTPYRWIRRKGGYKIKQYSEQWHKKKSIG